MRRRAWWPTSHGFPCCCSAGEFLIQSAIQHQTSKERYPGRTGLRGMWSGGNVEAPEVRKQEVSGSVDWVLRTHVGITRSIRNSTRGSRQEAQGTTSMQTTALLAYIQVGTWSRCSVSKRGDRLQLFPERSLHLIRACGGRMQGGCLTAPDPCAYASGRQMRFHPGAQWGTSVGRLPLVSALRL